MFILHFSLFDVAIFYCDVPIATWTSIYCKFHVFISVALTRCPCDECSISHMITCGLLPPEPPQEQAMHHVHHTGDPRAAAGLQPASCGGSSGAVPSAVGHGSGFPFSYDSSRYTVDVTPPSVSSSDSSEGPSSPVQTDAEHQGRPLT